MVALLTYKKCSNKQARKRINKFIAYKRPDKDNNEVSPQPGKSTVNYLSGNEGWSTVTYENFNADYQARNADRSARTPGTFQARDKDNNARTPAAYQRHDKDNNAVTG